MEVNKQNAVPDVTVRAAAGQHSYVSSLSITNAETACNENFLQAVTMQELYENVYPPKTPIIEGLLFPGMYFFVGAPKVGKSFFMAQLAYHVASGLPLWDYHVRQASVLYLALEDDYARLQKRLSRMFDVEGNENLHLAVRAKTLTEGLDDQIELFMKNHPDVRLIIIDTMQKIRDNDGDHYSYARDYEMANCLKRLADRHGICLLIVHHTRKMESEDSFEMISGTNGLLGAADGAFVLQKKKRTDRTAVLSVVGRDQQEQEITLAFDQVKCCWTFVKAETELWTMPPDPLLELVAGLLPEAGDTWTGTSTALLELLKEKDPSLELAVNALGRKLNVNAERLYNEYGIRFTSSRNHEGRLLELKKE